jgi:murein DD-endopeptidase MepM/ murein hydrolase activator NlpD
LRLIGCRSAREPRAPAQQVLAVAPDGTSLTARVGPLRIPTRLFLAVPELDDTGVDFQWPVDGSVASNFGRRRGGWHAGIDIWADLGAPIRAAAPGEVIVSGWEPSYGHRIKIRHAGGFTSVYAHNLENVVTVGDSVAQGAVIGSVGSSGRATSPHLHFEIRRDDVAYNPLHFLEAGWASSVSEAVGASLDDDPDHD